MSADERRAEYLAYLQSPEWQAKRVEALARAKNRCQVCNSTRRLDVHHRTYERFKDEHPDDLTVLCRPCHDLFHTAGPWVKTTPRPTAKRKSKPPRQRPTHQAVDLTTDKAARAVRSKLARMGPGWTFTTGQLANGIAEYNKSIIGTRLRYLAQAGEVKRLAKRKWRTTGNVPAPVSNPTTPSGQRITKRAASVLAIERVLQHSPSTFTANELKSMTGMSIARVNAAIGAMNFRRDIIRDGDGWRWNREAAELEAELDADLERAVA